jgi:hypothetical protein
MQRLSNIFLLRDCTLDYRSKRHISSLGEEDFLSIKTSKKIAREELTNPRTSIITRVILRHFTRYESPSEQQLKNFWEALKTELKDSRFRNGKIQRKGLIVARALRTTAATMLRFTRETLFFPRFENEDIAARMTHATTLTIEQVYARNPPPDSGGMAPHVYLGFGEKMLVNGCEISSQDTAWDSWLLRDVINRFIEAIEDAKGEASKEEAARNLEQLKSFIVKEFEAGRALNVDPEKAKDEVEKHYKGRSTRTNF